MKNKLVDSVPLDGTPVDKLHPRNLHRGRYDFEKLINAYPKLAIFVSRNIYGDESIDFVDAAAVRALNCALLIHYYGIKGWDIPARYLCPPIPGRADYLHYLADLMAQDGQLSPMVRVLDIGTGANCIYPLIGHAAYGWKFVASDIDSAALENAQRILRENPQQACAIELRLQTNRNSFFKGIIRQDERYDMTLCNPPFHRSMAAANAGTTRKWKNLGKAISQNPGLNFGGQGAELWCCGGEEMFVCHMIEESIKFKTNCLWFSSLISKSASLPGVYRALSKANVSAYRTVEMAQGQKKSRFVAWTFFNEQQRTSARNQNVIAVRQ